MRSINCLMPFAVACMVGFLSGCVKAPDQELAAARNAVTAAQEVEADKYMPNNFKNIQKALASAESEIELQGRKFFLSRSYARAKVLLRNATDLARQVVADAPGAKEEMKTQVGEGLTSAKEMAKETHGDIKRVPRSKGREVIAQMKADLKDAEKAIDKGLTEFAAGDILAAKEKLNTAQEHLKKIFDQLSAGKTDDLM